MQNRLVVVGILVVGLLAQIGVAAQSLESPAVTVPGRSSAISISPYAGATASPVTIFVTQRVSDTFDFEGTATPSAGASIVSYAWNFGDGATASGQKVSHRYAAAGWYQVSLTVVDTKQVTASTSTTVVPATGGGDSTGTGPTSLGIDLVVRGPRFGFSARATPSANSTIKSYSWNFGDGGTASGAAVAHYYKASGNYSVVLTVVDSNGVSATTTKIVNATLGNLSPGTSSPLATIVSSPKSSDAYDFNAAPTRSRVSIASYAWNFGDGSNAAGQAVSHRYMSSGTYTVTLTAVDSSGASSIATQSVYASVVTGSPPTASIIATATASDTFNFSSTASASGGATIVSYAWNFGDGGTGTGSTSSHRYLASGTYSATLTVTDSTGASGTATKSIVATVASPPPTVTITATQTALDTYDFIGAAIAAGGAIIASYAWNFGDGSTASGAAATHRYSTSGTFPVVLSVLDSKGASGTATKSVTATVAGPPTASGRVRISHEDTNWLNASTALLAPWVKGGGDWFDKNGVFNGPTPTIAIPVTTNTTTSIDISGIDGDLLLQGIYGWDNPTIDGVPAVGFWTDPSSNQSQPMPARWGNPAMILNPARGRTLTLTLNANPLGQTLRIDKVAGPPIQDYPSYVGASNTPDVWELEMTDYNAIVARAGGQGNIAGGAEGQFAYQPQFLKEANGLKYLRFAGTPANTRLISWFLPIPVLTTMHERYCIYIEDDVADGMVELGVKLSGFSNDNTTQPDLISWRLEHGGRSLPNNRGVYAFIDYLYDAESGSGFPAGKSMGGAMLRAGRWYVIEQAIRLNTAGVSDGYGEIWLNGQSVYKSDTIRFRNNAASKITMLHVNVYHGGLTPPKSSIHYRLAKIGVSSSYIGVPKELSTASAAPAWRKSMTIRDTFYAIDNTANMDGQAVLGNGSAAGSNIINAWNGLAVGPHTWYSAASGGHDQGNGNGWENKTIKIDLSTDAPRWELIHPGSPRSAVISTSDHYSDGLPVSRHTYYSAHFLESLDRVMLVGVAAPYAMGFASPAYWGGPAVDGFNIQTNKWDAAYTWPNAPPAAVYTAGSVAKNPATDDIYIAAREGFAKWTRATNSWATITPLNPDRTPFYSPGSWEFHPALVDPSRNRWCNFSEFKTMRCIDLSTKVLTVSPVTGSLPGFGDYSTVVHDLDNDRYVTVQGTIAYSINPVTGASMALSSVPAANNGVNNRLAYFKELGGIAYLSEFASNILFMPTR